MPAIFILAPKQTYPPIPTEATKLIKQYMSELLKLFADLYAQLGTNAPVYYARTEQLIDEIDKIDSDDELRGMFEEIVDIFVSIGIAFYCAHKTPLFTRFVNEWFALKQPLIDQLNALDEKA